MTTEQVQRDASREETMNGGLPVSVMVRQGGDEVVWSEVWRDDCYRFDASTVGNRVVVDVGANVGMATLRALSHGAAGVIAVEPDPENFRRLQHNVMANNLQGRVMTVPAAVAGHAGRLQVVRPAEHAEGNYGGSWTVEAAGAGPDVQCVTLDEVMSWVVGDQDCVLKIDCEGAEFDILRAASPETMRRFAYVAGEFHRFKDAARDVGGHGPLGELVTSLLETHVVEVIGRADAGGLFFGRRYAG